MVAQVSSIASQLQKISRVANRSRSQCKRSLRKQINLFFFSFFLFCISEIKGADQQRGNRVADQRLCFASKLVQSFNFINPKFQASCKLMWLYSPVYVGPGRKPRIQIFSCRGSCVDELGECPLSKQLPPLFRFITVTL